jgi:hypothetical protein
LTRMDTASNRPFQICTHVAAALKNSGQHKDEQCGEEAQPRDVCRIESRLDLRSHQHETFREVEDYLRRVDRQNQPSDLPEK